MKVNGKYLIEKICERLEEENTRTYDSEIINKIRKMKASEISQLINLGDVIKWHNERISK